MCIFKGQGGFGLEDSFMTNEDTVNTLGSGFGRTSALE